MNTHHQEKYSVLQKTTAFALLPLFFAGCGTPENFKTITPQKSEITQGVSVDATVEANMTADLSFQRSGEISGILVQENQEIKKGDILASIEADRLKIDVSRATSAVNMARARLNLKYSKPSRESIALSQNQIDEAKLELSHSQEQLKEAKQTTFQKIRIAEQEIETIQTKLKNAEKAYENIKTLGGVESTKAEKGLSDTLEKSRKQAISALDSLKTSLSLATDILEPSTESGRNRLAYIGFHSSQKLPTLDWYKQTKIHFQETETSVSTNIDNWSIEATQDTFQKLTQQGEEQKKLLDMLYELMNTAISNKDMSLAEIDSLKSQITNQQNILTSQISGIQNLEQGIESAYLGIEGSGASNVSQEDTAKAAVEDLKNSLALAESNLKNIQTQNTIAEQNIVRTIESKNLAVKRAQANYNLLVAPPRSVDVAELKANVDQQISALKQAQKNLEDAQIIAPFDGVVTNINFDIGENILSSQVMIVLMSKELQVSATLPEIEVVKVKIGSEAKISLDAFEEDQFLTGKVISIDRSQTLIQGAVYYDATIQLDDSEEKSKIKPGMTGEAFIKIENKNNALLVPQSALEYEKGKYFVKIDTDENPENFEKREVKTGIKNGENIEILSGLTEDDKIVIWEEK